MIWGKEGAKTGHTKRASGRLDRNTGGYGYLEDGWLVGISRCMAEEKGIFALFFPSPLSELVVSCFPPPHY